MSEPSVTIIDNTTGKTVVFPVLKSVHGPDVIDIRKLSDELNYFTYDPGFTSTASCQSKITFVDGDAGTLLYRGYPIEQLAERSSFLEVAYLLIFRKLPTKVELDEFTRSTCNSMLLHGGLLNFFNGFHYDAHPMAMVSAVMSSLSAFYHNKIDINDSVNREMTAVRIIAKIASIAAVAYKHMQGHPVIHPRNNLSYCGNILNMLFGLPTEPYEIDPIAEKALDQLLILHADHEQNASTSTVRLAGSTGTNPFAAVAAGCASLWGPAHGGAAEEVVRMLERIEKKENISRFVADAKNPETPFRLMGFGHRVYKNHDPRARIIRETCHQVLDSLGKDDPLLELAMEIETIALNDDFFVERNLYPNVDFYSGIIYKALGIPTEFYTVMFAIGRAPGWVSQWMEMLADPDQKIGRPRQTYQGPARRDYVEMYQRK